MTSCKETDSSDWGCNVEESAPTLAVKARKPSNRPQTMEDPEEEDDAAIPAGMRSYLTKQLDQLMSE